MGVRKDTITLSFGREATRRPLSGELARWLKEELSLSVSELKTVEYEFGSFRIFIKLKSSEKLESIVCKNDGERSMKLETGEKVKVTLSSEGCGAKVLRVKNLPSEVTDADLVKALQKYGVVGAIKWERYGPRSEFEGVLSGVRLVKMELKVENVPSYVRVAGEEAYIKYSGQKETCRSCGRVGHMRKNCPGREERRNTYAGRLAGDNNPMTPSSNDVIILDSVVGKGRDRKTEEGRLQDLGFLHDEDSEEELAGEEEEEKEEEESFEGSMRARYDELASRFAKPTATEIPLADGVTSDGSSAAVEEGSFNAVSLKDIEVVTVSASVDAGEQSPAETDSLVPAPEKRIKCLFDNNLLRDDPPPPTGSPVTAAPHPHPLARFSVANGAVPRPSAQQGASSSRPTTPSSQPSTPSKIPVYQPPASKCLQQSRAVDSLEDSQIRLETGRDEAKLTADNSAATRAAAKAAAIASEAAAKFAAKAEEARNSNKRALETSPGEGKEGGKQVNKRKGKSNKK